MSNIQIISEKEIVLFDCTSSKISLDFRYNENLFLLLNSEDFLCAIQNEFKKSNSLLIIRNSFDYWETIRLELKLSEESEITKTILKFKKFETSVHNSEDKEFNIIKDNKLKNKFMSISQFEINFDKLKSNLIDFLELSINIPDLWVEFSPIFDANQNLSKIFVSSYIISYNVYKLKNIEKSIRNKSNTTKEFFFQEFDIFPIINSLHNFDIPVLEEDNHCIIRKQETRM